jgi:hypothetical protein
MAAGGEPVTHRRDRRVVRRDQAAPEGVRQQLAGEVVDELGLATLGEIATQAVEAVSRAAVGERGAGLDGTAAQVAVAALADRAVALEGQADRVEPSVASRALLRLAVPGQELRQRQLAEPSLILG